MPIVTFNRHFVTLWVGAPFYAGDLVTLVAAVNGVLLALISFWSWPFTAQGLSVQLVPQYIIFTILNLALSLILTFRLGLVGPLLGTMISAMCVSFWAIPYFMERLFAVRARRVYGAALRPLTVALPVGAVSFWYASQPHARSWPILAVEMAVSGLVALAVTWFAALDAEEKDLVRNIVGARFRRPKERG
jgi:O-antigen/teichoic acid export membrane protein